MVLNFDIFALEISYLLLDLVTNSLIVIEIKKSDYLQSSEDKPLGLLAGFDLFCIHMLDQMFDMLPELVDIDLIFKLVSLFVVPFKLIHHSSVVFQVEVHVDRLNDLTARTLRFVLYLSYLREHRLRGGREAVTLRMRGVNNGSRECFYDFLHFKY
jgi:hypothetical protein